MNRPHSLPSALLLFLALLPSSALAHAGHNKAPGEEDAGQQTGPITITFEAEQNLGLTVEAADLRTIQQILTVLGHVELDPARVAVVASRISGRITRLAVKEGDQIAAGDYLLTVESRQVGDPPPTVKFTSPIAGTIYDQPVFTGDSVDPNARLLTIADLSEIYVIGRLYEGQVAEVKLGQAVRIRSEAYPDVAFTGTVAGFIPHLDPVTRTLGVRVRVKNPDRQLLPNMRATLHIVTAEAGNVVTVPLSAVLGGSGNLFVFVQDDKNPLSFLRTPVVLGQRDDRYVEVIEGVLPGSNVVTVGNYQLQYVLPTSSPAVAKPATPADTPEAAHNADGHTH